MSKAANAVRHGAMKASRLYVEGRCNPGTLRQCITVAAKQTGASFESIIRYMAGAGARHLSGVTEDTVEWMEAAAHACGEVATHDICVEFANLAREPLPISPHACLDCMEVFANASMHVDSYDWPY